MRRHSRESCKTPSLAVGFFAILRSSIIGETVMTELTPAAREEIRLFLREERKGMYVIGGVSAITAIVTIGGFLSFALSELKTTGELAARQTIESIRVNDFDPELRRQRERIDAARTEFELEQRKLAAMTALLERSQLTVRELAERAEAALSDLNKVKGSFVFAETFSNISGKLLTVSERLGALEQALAGDTRTLEAGDTRTLEEAFPGVNE